MATRAREREGTLEVVTPPRILGAGVLQILRWQLELARYLIAPPESKKWDSTGITHIMEPCNSGGVAGKKASGFLTDRRRVAERTNYTATGSNPIFSGFVGVTLTSPSPESLWV